MAGSGIKLLIVDDEFNTRQALMRYLGRKFEVTGAENGSEAIEQLKENDFDLVLTDLRMPPKPRPGRRNVSCSPLTVRFPKR